MARKGYDCKICKYDVYGVYCSSHTDNCRSCEHKDEIGHCKCMTVLYGKECPYYAVRED